MATSTSCPPIVRPQSFGALRVTVCRRRIVATSSSCPRRSRRRRSRPPPGSAAHVRGIEGVELIHLSEEPDTSPDCPLPGGYPLIAVFGEQGPVVLGWLRHYHQGIVEALHLVEALIRLPLSLAQLNGAAGRGARPGRAVPRGPAVEPLPDRGGGRSSRHGRRLVPERVPTVRDSVV